MNKPLEGFDMMPIGRVEKLYGVVIEDGHIVEVFKEEECEVKKNENQ